MLVNIGYDEFCERVNDSACGEFSRGALEYLFEYYEEFENYILDIVAVHCDWSEYALCDFITEYGVVLAADETIEGILDSLDAAPIALDDLPISFPNHVYQGVLLPNGNILSNY